MSETLSSLDKVIILGLGDAHPEDQAMLRAFTQTQYVEVAGATLNLISRGLLVEVEDEIMPTAAGIRAAYGATA